MDKFLSIIIPAYNETKRIKQSLDAACEYLNDKHYEYEIIVVDDGSTDDTVQIAREFGGNVTVLPQAKNLGKGAAVRRGMLAAKGDIRIFTDADFSTPIYEIEKLIEKLEAGADICIGSRALDPSMIKEHQPFYREFMGKTFNKFVQLMFFKGISDTQCGFKGFTKEAAEKIFPQAKINGFSFDVELLYLASKEGLKVEQVSVEWYNDARSKVNPVKDSMMMLIELFRIKKLHK